MDALRALAIAGVILGHWLVTALVLSPSASGTKLHDMSPLQAMPWLAPMSWLFQTLAIFFLVGGYSAARQLQGQLPGLAAQADDPADPPGGRAGRGLGAAHRGHAAGRDAGRDRAHRGHPGPRPTLVPVRVRRADRADPARGGAGAPSRCLGRAAARRPGGRGGRGPVPPRRPGLAGLAECRRRLAGALPARHRLGPRLVPRLEGARRAAGGRDGRHRGADHLGRATRPAWSG